MSGDNIAHDLTKLIGEVLNNADDSRLPNDTLWYNDFATISEELANRIFSKYYLEEYNTVEGRKLTVEGNGLEISIRVWVENGEIKAKIVSD